MPTSTLSALPAETTTRRQELAAAWIDDTPSDVAAGAARAQVGESHREIEPLDDRPAVGSMAAASDRTERARRAVEHGRSVVFRREPLIEDVIG